MTVAEFDAWWEKKPMALIGAKPMTMAEMAPGLVASLEYLIAEYGLKGVQHALTELAGQ